jgi:hypothetical protein
MNFEEQLKNIQNDTAIKNYFEDRDLLCFIKTYMQVDSLIGNKGDIEPLRITNQLTQIQESINAINMSLKQQLYECLGNVTNNEIRKMITEIYNNKEINLKYTLDNFVNSLSNINSQNLNEFDRKTIGIIQNMQSTFNTSLDSHNIAYKINSIDSTLNQLHNTFTNNSSKKGEITENILFNNLIKAFSNCEVLNTSQTPNSGDIMIRKENKPDILIDSKNFQNNVPKIDLEKFYRDCELNNCSGILCNVNNGIANKDNFQVDIQDSRIYVYIANHEFDNTLFQLAVKIIYNIHEIIKKNKTNMIEIDKELFERIKIEFNFFLQTFKQHIATIKQNITSLEQLAMNQLEQFFKRSNFNDLKPFSCASCGAGYGSAKALKKHMSEKHDIKLVGKKGRKPIGERSEENQQGEQSENSDSENEPKVQKAKVPKEPKSKQVKGIPVEIPTEIPAETPVETPIEIPAEMPSETPVDPLDEIVISNSHLRTF